MNVICYHLTEDAYITAVDWPGWDTIQQDKDPKHPYWLIIEDITASELAENIQSLNLHPLIQEDCLSPDHSTLVDHYLDAVYLEFPTNPSHDRGEVAFLSIICVPDLIVTIERGDGTQLHGFIATLQHEKKLAVGNTANLLYLLIDYFTDDTITQVLALRQQLNLLEKKFVQDLTDIDFNVISDLKRQVTQLESICEDQLYCAKSIVRHDDPVIDTAGQEVYFDDLINNGEYSLRSIMRLTDRIKDLQDTFTIQNHESQEKRLRFLTIISVIFLPLTFITGFFGMNFIDMRLLRVAYGSFIAFAIMVIIILGLLWYFKSRGWFD
jgi:magnesium transporter